MSGLKLPWICFPLKSVQAHWQDTEIHRSTCFYWLAVRTDHASPKEDRKLCPTRSNLGLVFRAKAPKKVLQSHPVQSSMVGQEQTLQLHMFACHLEREETTTQQFPAE